MKLSREEGRRIVSCDHEDFIEIEYEIVEETMWNLNYEGIYLHNPSGKHYKLEWSEGVSEFQEEGPFEYNDPKPIEVRPVSKTITAWEPVNVTSNDKQ